MRIGIIVVTVALVAVDASQQPKRAVVVPTARPRAAMPVPAQQANPKVVVYKSASCGCCGQWVDYMRANGYTVEVHNQDDLTAIKRAAGVSDANASCHP